MGRSFKEMRLHRGKPPQEFACHLLHRENGYLVLRYVNPGPAKINDIPVKKGSVTIAHYWNHKNYILWKIKEPDGLLKGYLFHICKNTAIGKNFVRYEDLELDIWFDPEGHATVLDQDEVDNCFEQGLIHADEISLINHQKKEILTNFKSIVQNLWSEDGKTEPCKPYDQQPFN